MSEENPPINTETKSDKTQSKKETNPKRFPFVAALFNWLLPGLGYFYCGKFKLGIVVALIVPLIFIVADFISINLSSGINILFSIEIYTITSIGLAIHAFILAKRKKDYKLLIYNKVMYYVLFWVLASYYRTNITEANFYAFQVKNGSMENTIMKNELVVIRMNYYGLYNPVLKSKIFNFISPERGDLVYHSLYISASRDSTKYYTIKRVLAIPGDTVKIKNKICYINGIEEKKFANYKYDDNLSDSTSSSFIYPKWALWNEDNYGPLYIPKKGDIIYSLNNVSIDYWKQLILSENYSTDQDKNEKLISDILSVGFYEIKHNYYFTIGDDRNNSLDSRYSGLVPEEEILGKPEYIYFNIKNLKDIFSSESRVGLIIE